MTATTEALRPLGAGEMMDRAINAARLHFWLLLRPAFVAAVLGTVCDVVIGWPGVHLGKVFVVLSTLCSGLAESLAIASAFTLVSGGQPTPANAWQMVRPRVIAATMGYALKWYLSLGALVLAILPGMYLLSAFFAVPALSVIEGLGFNAAQARSYQLSKRNLKRVFLSVGVVETAFVLITFAISYSVGAVFHSLPPGAIPVLNNLLWMLFLPFRSVLTILVYLDCRFRSEGYDLEQMAGADPVQPSPA
jgi:hypothetical protein